MKNERRNLLDAQFFFHRTSNNTHPQIMRNYCTHTYYSKKKIVSCLLEKNNNNKKNATKNEAMISSSRARLWIKRLGWCMLNVTHQQPFYGHVYHIFMFAPSIYLFMLFSLLLLLKTAGSCLSVHGFWFACTYVNFCRFSPSLSLSLFF